MMRRIAGLALILIAICLAYGSIAALILYTSRGAAIATALADPVFLVPIVRAVLAAIAGILAMFAWRGGAMFALSASLLTTLFGTIVMLSGGDVSLWRTHMIWAGLLAIPTTILFVRQRNP